MLLFGFAPHVTFAQAPVPVEIMMENMPSAIQSDSLAAFVSSGDPAFKAAITEEIFDQISESLGPRLKQGYTAKFLAQLNPQGFTALPPTSAPVIQSNYWYCCENPEGYYPEVNKCTEGWFQVAPQPPNQ